MTGSITDSVWGRWEIKGAADASLASGSVEVNGLTPIEVSTDRIARLPLVNPALIRDYPFQVRVRAACGWCSSPAGVACRTVPRRGSRMAQRRSPRPRSPWPGSPAR